MTDKTGRDQLKAFVERIERLEEEKKAIADDVKEVYGEAKDHGFDARAIRVIIRKRRLDQEERLNQEQLVETYMVALGMGWGKSGDDIDAALERRRTEAGKAKTARGKQPPPSRPHACAARAEVIRSGPIVAGATIKTLVAGETISSPAAASIRAADVPTVSTAAGVTSRSVTPIFAATHVRSPPGCRSPRNPGPGGAALFLKTGVNALSFRAQPPPRRLR